jgi:hypothetical protein
LTYDGTAPLTLIGTGQSIVISENATLLAVTEGADVDISNLSFEGPGGFSIEARGDTDGAAGKGIFVDVRDDQTGTVSVTLTNVSVTGTAGHGIHISDCTLADDCGGGSGGAGEGSPASIALSFINVAVIDAAFGRFDADGVRVDERGAGDIYFGAIGSDFIGVGADGVELDEGQEGSIYVNVSASVFEENGAYCDPALLEAFLPEVDEAEFEEGTTAEADIPGPITGSPDDGCFERAVDLYDDGSVEAYEFAIDVDDGFDIDEAGPGGMFVTVIDSAMNGNYDEGFDFDEEDAGDIDVIFIATEASGNTDDGYKFSEEGEGHVLALVTASSATNNGGVGFVFEEADGGDVEVVISYAETMGNDDGDLGVEVVQEDEGAGMALIMASDIAEGVEVEGVSLSME